jgi:hypothetical protein
MQRMHPRTSDQGAGDEPGPAPRQSRTVQHCPWCGEHVGSFWGRRDDDGGHWCEGCQAFFRVEER